MLKQICQSKGGIILFHDIQSFTVDNLKSWIQAIKTAGHQIVSLDKHVPQVKGPFPPEDCELDSSGKPVRKTESTIDEILEKIK
jgi:hypothetical protein